MSQQVIKGGCLCGAIRYKIKGEILNMAHCHCRSCQRATGSGYYPFIAINKEDIEFDGDVREYMRVGGSGKNISTGFCGVCGSTLYGRPEKWPTIMTISASSLDDPSPFEANMEVWLEDAQPWVTIDPLHATFQQNPK